MSVKSDPKHDMIFFEVVQKRVSVRNYKPDPIPSQHLEQILEAASQAPNAGNQQSWRFLVVQEKDRLKEFRDFAWRNRKRWLLDNGYEADIDEGMKAHYNKLLGAPLQLVVLVDTAVNYRGYAEQDGALAAENIMLAARALGYGSVMITGSVSASTVRKFFKVPKRYSINCLIPIGVPESWPEKKERKPLSEVVFYERVPRRSQEE
jgi:nitroreductase